MADIEDLGEILARRDFGSCSCPDCASLCHGVPGIYDPAHINRLIESGQTTLAALVPHLVEDYFLGNEMTRGAGDEAVETVFYLRPRMSSEGAGGLAPMIPTVGSCSRLGPGGCTLARGEMPVGCISAFACREGSGYDKNRAPEMWGTDEGRDLIRRFEAESRRQTPDIALGQRAVLAEQAMFAQLGPMAGLLTMMSTLKVQERRRKARDVIARIQERESKADKEKESKSGR
jgi:hypothetical protein